MVTEQSDGTSGQILRNAGGLDASVHFRDRFHAGVAEYCSWNLLIYVDTITIDIKHDFIPQLTVSILL